METINRTLTCIDTPADRITLSASTTAVRFLTNHDFEQIVEVADISFDEGENEGEIQVIAYRRCDNQAIVIVNGYDLEETLNDVDNQALNQILLDS